MHSLLAHHATDQFLENPAVRPNKLFGSKHPGPKNPATALAAKPSTARLVDSDWIPVNQSPDVSYRNYYDVDGTNLLITPLTNGPVLAPQSGGSGKIDLRFVGSRLMNAVIRDGFLYTCQHVGLSGTNGGYAGDESGSTVDRSAVQWFKLQLDAEGSLSYHSHHRLFDSAVSSQWYYYYPSIAVNCAADVLLGFSGSSPNNFVSALYAWRPSSTSTTTSPVILQGGTGYFPNNKIGDYSFTSVDPSDSVTFWTVQQYSLNGTPYWGTWIGSVRKNL